MPDVKPFTVRWRPSDVDTMLGKVAAYGFPIAPLTEDGWRFGCDAGFLKALCAYWSDGYDWRVAEAELNRFPQFTVRVEDFDIHFVHVVGEASGKRPLLLSHGWPGSHYEFWGVVERLAFPSRFGGNAADAFDLVIPSLPGFGFSSKPQRPIGPQTTARLFNRLMTEALGYDRYLAQGGDWGAVISSWMANNHPDHVKAIHLNMLAFRPSDGATTDEERAWLMRSDAATQAMGGYLRLQVTRPQSIAWMAAGNPVGQAAWIVERFHDWADLSERGFTEVFSIDQLLTNVMIYVMTDSFTTAAWFYRGLIDEGGMARRQAGPGPTPMGLANFPGDPLQPPPPRSFVERAYNLTWWSTPARGGHFAAMEQPALFADDVRAWARELD